MISRPLVMFGTISIISAITNAQAYRFEGSASFSWQSSTDQGVTWRSNIVETSPGADLLIRAHVAFESGPGRYLNYTAFDPFVTSAGLGDQADSFSFVFPWTSTAFLASFHEGSTLRIEYGNDGAPPGQGAGWVVANQNPSIHPITSANPISIFSFRYHADSTPGDRILETRFQRPASWEDGRFMRIGVFADPDLTVYVPMVTVEPLTIRVIPAPSALGALAAGFIVAARRRR